MQTMGRPKESTMVNKGRTQELPIAKKYLIWKGFEKKKLHSCSAIRWIHFVFKRLWLKINLIIIYYYYYYYYFINRKSV